MTAAPPRSRRRGDTRRGGRGTVRGVGRRDDRLPRVPVTTARRLLLEGCGLGSSPIKATSRSVISLVRRLGFVQIDSISSVERAHHLIMHARLDSYAPRHLAHHAENTRELFEHWTHDASLVRSDWLPWWSHRLERDRRRFRASAWMRKRLGRRWVRSTREVMALLEAAGPLGVREVHERLDGARSRSTGWWEWSPRKSALEYLWRIGEVAIHSRRGFEKRYDLASRVHGPRHAPPEPEAHRGWACSQALERLGAATPREIAGFLGAISPADAREWCEVAAREGRIEAVRLERLGAGPRLGFARRGWSEVAGSEEIDATPRLLAPFDPLIRDRARTRELFGFDHRFEAFIPAPRRLFGYYAMPVLVGERLVGRLDLASDRGAGSLRVDRAFAEPGGSRREFAGLAREAAARLARQLDLRLDWRARRIAAVPSNLPWVTFSAGAR